MALDLSVTIRSLWCKSDETVLIVYGLGSCKNEPSRCVFCLVPFLVTAGFVLGDDGPFWWLASSCSF